MVIVKIGGKLYRTFQRMPVNRLALKNVIPSHGLMQEKPTRVIPTTGGTGCKERCRKESHMRRSRSARVLKAPYKYGIDSVLMRF